MTDAQRQAEDRAGDDARRHLRGRDRVPARFEQLLLQPAALLSLKILSKAWRRFAPESHLSPSISSRRLVTSLLLGTSEIASSPRERETDRDDDDDERYAENIIRRTSGCG
jgi:hypothetical protein